MAGRREREQQTEQPLDDLDPRLARSRNRLVDAASALLSSGGVDAVTVGAVSRMSRVARTTLHRHFDGTTDLLAAAFERLLPHAQIADTSGPIREALVRLLRGQAALIEQAPLQLTALAWLAMVPEEPGGRPNTLAPLRARVIGQYREPFDRVLNSEAARSELDELDIELAIAQLVGPLVFARLSGLRSMSAADCAQLVDDFIAAHRRN